MDEAAGGKAGVLREDFMALVRVRSEMQSLEVLEKKRKKKRWGEKLRDVVMVKTVMDDSRREE